MGEHQRTGNVVILGAGPSGIAMAHTLKHKLGLDDFLVYEKLHGVGGTWLTNTYPGWSVARNITNSLGCHTVLNQKQWL